MIFMYDGQIVGSGSGGDSSGSSSGKGIIKITSADVPNLTDDERANNVYAVYSYSIMQDRDTLTGFLIFGDFFPVGQDNLPWGAIILWSGPKDEIPTGWALCDGRNGTPDLRSRFIIGSDGTNVGDTGGSSVVPMSLVSHNHSTSVVMPTGTEMYSVGGLSGTSVPNFLMGNANTKTNVQSTNASYNGGSTEVEYLPPYYSLCYIMKL